MDVALRQDRRQAEVGQEDELRRAFTGLIDLLNRTGRADEARTAAELAVGLGLWTHPLQRPLHHLPSLSPVPVHDPAAFWFVPHLEAAAPRIRAEVAAALAAGGEGFLPVEEPLLGAGDWKQVTLYEAGRRSAAACARFPVTAEAIGAVPEAAAAGPGVVTLSWLQPGSHVVPHCGSSNAKLRVHLGLLAPPGARMRVGEETVTWQEGRCVVFDDSFEHEVWHEGDLPRLVLLFDVWHPALGREARRRITDARAGLFDQVRSFLQEKGVRRAELDGERVLLHPAEAVETLLRRHLSEEGCVAVELRDGEIVAERMRAAR